MDIVEVATVSPPRRLNRDLAASRQSIDLVLQDPAMDTPPRRCPTPGDDDDALKGYTPLSARWLRGAVPRYSAGSGRPLLLLLDISLCLNVRKKGSHRELAVEISMDDVAVRVIEIMVLMVDSWLLLLLWWW